MLKNIFAALLFIFAFLSQAKSQTMYMAQAPPEKQEEDDTELSVYDPFMDYLDFEDPETEKQSMIFFRTGRFLSVGGYAGYRLFPEPSSHLLHSFAFGGFLNFFINLNVALQFSYSGSLHNVLKNPQPPLVFSYQDLGIVLGQSFYNNFNLDFKYYWNRDLLIRTIAFFNPYIFGGAVFSRRVSSAYSGGKQINYSDNGLGINGGAGIEINISKKFYYGFQIQYTYLTFSSEKPISSAVGSPEFYLPHNIATALFFFGANFQ